MLKLKIPKKNIFILGLLLIVGLGLRLISISQSLWLDEAISVALTKNPLFLIRLPDYMKGDFNPPLFNLILYFWLKIFPSQELFIRLPSLIFGLGACFFTYKIGGLFNKKVAFISLMLIVTSSLHIYYSQEARMYSLATFCVTGSMYYFIKLITTQRKLFMVYYSIFTILVLYSHYLAWLILPVQWLYILMPKNRKIIPRFLLTQLLIAFSLMPLLPLLFTQLLTGQKAALENQVWHDVVGQLSLKNVALVPVKFIIGRTSFADKNLYFVIAGGLMLFYVVLLWQVKRVTSLGKLIWYWLILPIFLGAVISLKIPVFSYFRFLYCLPAFYLLIALGTARFKKINLIIFFLILVNLYFSTRYLGNPDFQREDWQGAVKALHLYNKNAPVLVYQPVNAPFVFYDQKHSLLIAAEEKETIKDYQQIWFIPYSQPIFDPQDEVRKYLYDQGFYRTYEEHFRGVTLEKYEKAVAFQYN